VPNQIFKVRSIMYSMRGSRTERTGHGSERPSNGRNRMSVSAAFFLTFLLAALTYLTFYLLRLPLARNETIFVSCGWAGIVFLTRSFLGRDQASAPGKDGQRRTRASRRPGSGTASLVLAFAWVSGMIMVSRSLAQAPEVTPELQENRLSGAACSVEYAEIATNTSVHLYAYLDSANGAGDAVWNVSGGTVIPSRAGTMWDFHGTPAGVYRAEARLQDKTTGPPLCAVEVVAFEPVRSGQVTGRSFLVMGDQELSGYSLYSYLLLGSRPNESTRARYLRTIQALLQYVEAANDLEIYFSRSQLNLTAIPVTGKPPANVTANWVLANYDFVRARALLARLGGTKTDGPYIVSSPGPLTNTKSLPPYLFEDLTVVPDAPPQLLSWWIREFVNQSTQRTTWDGAKIELFALRIRTTIAILANGAPAIREGVRKWISFVK